ncbi:MAG: efflux RND transporter periplasmic adaptor subunit [Balneolaceae bacterium]
MYIRTVLVICWAVLLLMTGCASETEPERAERTTAITGYELERMDLSRVVRASATVEPEQTVTIASRMSGLIIEMNAREGDRVSQGDLLLRFDMEEQRAELERARAERDLAAAVYERNQVLFEREAVSRAEYEEVRANLRIAESEVQLLETRSGFGSVRAPHDLVVLRRYVEQGDAVATNEPLFRVADTNRLVIRPGIPERDVVALDEGQETSIQIDAFPGQPFRGTIQRIFPSADENSRLFTVEISLRAEQHNRVIRPGYLARVSMDAERRPGVLAVPSESLLASGAGERFVYLINSDNRLERRDVVTGIERRNWTEITEGLEPGDRVVGANPSNLRENILVNVTRWVENDAQQVAVRR